MRYCSAAAPSGRMPRKPAADAQRGLVQELLQAAAAMPRLQNLRLLAPAWARAELSVGQTLAKDDCEQTAERLRRAAAQQRLDIRKALLLGTHARCGRHSPIKSLTRDALERVLQLCAPLSPTVVVECA